MIDNTSTDPSGYQLAQTQHLFFQQQQQHPHKQFIPFAFANGQPLPQQTSPPNMTAYHGQQRSDLPLKMASLSRNSSYNAHGSAPVSDPNLDESEMFNRSKSVK